MLKTDSFTDEILLTQNIKENLKDKHFAKESNNNYINNQRNFQFIWYFLVFYVTWRVFIPSLVYDMISNENKWNQRCFKKCNGKDNEGLESSEELKRENET